MMMFDYFCIIILMFLDLPSVALCGAARVSMYGTFKITLTQYVDTSIFIKLRCP